MSQLQPLHLLVTIGRQRWQLVFGSALAIGAVIVLALAILTPAAKPPVPSATPGPSAPETGHFAPMTALMGLDGQTSGLDSLKGKVVILNFWYIACDGCRIELPALEQAYLAHSGQGLIILGANAVDSASDIQAFTRQIGLTYPVVTDANQVAVKAYEVTRWPTSFIIDRSGVIRYVSIGPLDKGTIERVTKPLLAEK